MTWSDVPCKIWPGTPTSRYGRVSVNGKEWYVHRLTWTQHYGPIPEGMHVCHHCDVTKCYEEQHLFLGTQKDNLSDMATKGRGKNQNSRKTHCWRGHLFDEENTLIIKGHRLCRACARIRYQANKKVSAI